MQSYTCLFLFLFSSFFVACIDTKQQQDKTKEVVVKHLFSNNVDADIFRLHAKGNDILKGRIFFTITTAKGELIHSESFDGYSLIDYGLAEKNANPTDDDRRAYIRKRMQLFFDKESFLIPAIKPAENFEAQYSKKAYWESIKKDPTAIGFYYLIGSEDGRSIAYSKELKKVVMYFNCC
ncbi:MAG: hypothetical protein ACPG5B_12655 [Chitinophagales bacterium]